MDSAYAAGPKHRDLMRGVGTGGLHVYGHGLALRNKKPPRTMWYDATCWGSTRKYGCMMLCRDLPELGLDGTSPAS